MGVGVNSGGGGASGVDPETHGVGEEEGGRKASGVEENPGGVRHGVGQGGQIVSGQLDLPQRRQGGQIFSGRLDPQRKGRGS